MFEKLWGFDVNLFVNIIFRGSRWIYSDRERDRLLLGEADLDLDCDL